MGSSNANHSSKVAITEISNTKAWNCNFGDEFGDNFGVKKVLIKHVLLAVAK